ncbi:MAG: SMP-30/gluconolactonase/LRE family protein, partial [Burkholderiales bacterium]
MFALPKIVETRVFARLPEALKTADRNNAWVLGQPLGAPVGSLLEGPCFDRDGNFWCVDIQNGRIFKLTRDGQFQVIAEYDGWPNGLKFHKDGRGFIADYKHG